MDGGFEDLGPFEAQATKPLSVFTQAPKEEQSTVTRVASTTLRSNFIFVDGKVIHNSVIRVISKLGQNPFDRLFQLFQFQKHSFNGYL